MRNFQEKIFLINLESTRHEMRCRHLSPAAAAMASKQSSEPAPGRKYHDAHIACCPCIESQSIFKDQVCTSELLCCSFNRTIPRSHLFVCNLLAPHTAAANDLCHVETRSHFRYFNIFLVCACIQVFDYDGWQRHKSWRRHGPNLWIW